MSPTVFSSADSKAPSAQWIYHGVAGLLLVVTTFSIYSNSMQGPFVFDDAHNILSNDRIRVDRLQFSKFWEAAFESPSKNRPVANISFALNWYFGGLDPFGFHIVNTAIHAINGFLAYVFAWMLLGLANRRDDSISNVQQFQIALATSLIFVAHPIQSQSVTYIVQRMTSMSTMFFFIALMCYLRGRTRSVPLLRYGWWGFALVSWILAIGSKPIAITLPAVILTMEWLFLRRSTNHDGRTSGDVTNNSVLSRWCRHPRWRVAWLVMGLIGLTLVVNFVFFEGNVFRVISRGYQGRTEFTLFDRLQTQARVLSFYLSLLFYPDPERLNLLHYIFPPLSENASSATVLGLFVLLQLVGLACGISSSHPVLAFCMGWYLIGSVVESTVIPLEMIYEHRNYLPCFGFALFTVWTIHRICRGRNQWFWLLPTLVIIVSLCVMTHTRNRDWCDELTLWGDVIVKSPQEARGWNNRGKAYANDENYELAVADYLQAISRKFRFVEAHTNLGNAYVELGNEEKSIFNLTRAIQFQPLTSVFYFNRAVANETFGDQAVDSERTAYYELAQMDYRRVVEINPEFFTSNFNLGVVYDKMGLYPEAIQEFNAVIRMDSENVSALNNRADVYLKIQQPQQALADFDDVLRLEPTFAKAFYNRANAYLALGNQSSALTDLDRAIQLEPNLHLAYYNRGNIQMNLNQYDAAIQDFTEVIHVDPSYQAAYNNRGLCYLGKKQFELAIRDCDKAIQINPKQSIPYVSRGNARTMMGQHKSAILDYNAAIALDPNLPDVFFNRGISRDALGDQEVSQRRRRAGHDRYMSAVRDFNRAIRFRPSAPEYFQQRAKTQLKLQNYKKAWIDVQRCVQLGGRPNPQLMEVLRKKFETGN